MKTTIIYQKEDFLQYQLYTASKSKRVSGNRTKSWLITTGTFWMIAFVTYLSGSRFFTIYFLVIGGLSLLFLPRYLRHKYKRHYSKYVEENHRNLDGLKSEIEITSDFIFTKDNGSESRIKMSEIEIINEIQDYFFLKTKGAVAFILPKRGFIQMDLINEIYEIARINNIPVNRELDWHWK